MGTLLVGGLPLKPRCKRTACLQLFSEDAGDIGERVRAALMAEGAVIEDEALEVFCADLPGHRAIANSEIEKLALYLDADPTAPITAGLPP